MLRLVFLSLIFVGGAIAFGHGTAEKDHSRTFSSTPPPVPSTPPSTTEKAGRQVNDSSVPAPSSGTDPQVDAINALPSTTSEASLLATLGPDKILSLNQSKIAAIKNTELRNRISELKVALNKNDQELLEYWKTNKSQMGKSPESKAMRAALDKRMKEFPGLNKLHEHTGGSKEELFEKMLQLKAAVNDPSFANDPQKQREAIHKMVQTIMATDGNNREQLQKDLVNALADPNLSPENRKLLQGMDLALKIERGAARANPDGKVGPMEAGALNDLQKHPFLAGLQQPDAMKTLSNFADIQLQDQQRIKDYWDAAKVMQDPNATEAQREQARGVLSTYGDTSDWHARQFHLSNGKDQKHLDGMIATGKMQGTLSANGDLHFASSNHVTGGKPVNGDFNAKRDEGLFHHVVNTGSPKSREDLASYARARGAQNDGGAYHAPEAKRAKDDLRRLTTAANDESIPVAQRPAKFESELNKIAEERVTESLGARTDKNGAAFDKEVERVKADIRSNTRIAGHDASGNLQWGKPQFPDAPPATEPPPSAPPSNSGAPGPMPPTEEPTEKPKAMPPPMAEPEQPPPTEPKPMAPAPMPNPSTDEKPKPTPTPPAAKPTPTPKASPVVDAADGAINKPYYDEREKGRKLEEQRQADIARRAKEKAEQEAKEKAEKETKEGKKVEEKTPEQVEKERRLANRKQEREIEIANKDAAESHVKELISERKAETCRYLDLLCWRRKNHLEKEISEAQDKVISHRKRISALDEEISKEQ